MRCWKPRCKETATVEYYLAHGRKTIAKPCCKKHVKSIKVGMRQVRRKSNV